MKRVISFSKYFLPAVILSVLLAGAGIAGYVYFKGFNMGVDFQAGLLQEIQFAPSAFALTYSGRSDASVSISRSNLTVVISGGGVDEVQHDFPFTGYGTVGDLTRGLSAIEGITVRSDAPAGALSASLIQSTQNDSFLGAEPYTVHYLPPDAAPIPIEDVRASLLPLGSVSVQILGEPAQRRFMIRMEDEEIANTPGVVDRSASSEKILATLENTFGQGGVAVARSDYVGSRFSKHLSDQAGLLLGLTLLLILVYSSIRFRPQYAIGAVLALIHDGLIMVAFIVWTRLEFNTTTIAAILTILGYSINDTIVIFDRIRETRKIFPDDPFVDIMNRAISESLGRTIITTVTTMLAVTSLYIFTSGSMKDFALVLLVGMLSGVYSTIFIASGFVNFWEKNKQRREKKLSESGRAVKAEARIAGKAEAGA